MIILQLIVAFFIDDINVDSEYIVPKAEVN